MTDEEITLHARQCCNTDEIRGKDAKRKHREYNYSTNPYKEGSREHKVWSDAYFARFQAIRDENRQKLRDVMKPYSDEPQKDPKSS